MTVRDIQIENFRNHTRTGLEFGSGVNTLLGKNGQGKTNILEAISCLCLTKSFYAASDATLVQFEQESFEVEGTMSDDAGAAYTVSLEYDKKSGEKVFSVNGVRVERLASVIGQFPVVVLSPENNAITFGAPSDRRKFIDLLLSQLSRAYFEELLEYRHVLQQRNRILFEAKQRRTIRGDILEPWDRSLAGHGARIVQRRSQLVEEFREYVARLYAELVETREEPTISYVSVPKANPKESLESIGESILFEIKNKCSEEYRRGLSLVGPHRDDLVFQLNGTDLQKYASQGQHKTFLIALKMAEFYYLKDKRGETPILLLDDVLSELDEARSRSLLSFIAELGQTVVTTTDEAPFRDTIHWSNENRKYYVEAGTCRPINVGNGKEAAVGA
jgi:DNA replication and repair protein RecF